MQGASKARPQMSLADSSSAHTAALATPAAPVVCAQTGWAMLELRGRDALTFLQGQLSSDVASLGPGAGQYWSYNSPKGRMLANGVLWRVPAPDPETGVAMLVAADLAEPIRRRLSMFVLRADVSIAETADRRALIGVAGDAGAKAVRDALGVAVTASTAIEFDDDATAFTLPDGRIIVGCPPAHAPAVQAALARHARIVDTDAWRWFGIAAGVPWIAAATSDRFVPQTANWDLLGGVNFQKGCYPGQEIVARMQYLGRLKERLYAFRTDARDVAAAARLYSAAFGNDQACGVVVDAAPDPAGGTALLAIVQQAAIASDDIRLGDPAGAPLVRQPLPYDVAAPTPPRTPRESPRLALAQANRPLVNVSRGHRTRHASAVCGRCRRQSR